MVQYHNEHEGLRPPAVPGMELLVGAVDSHVHCAPHINQRTVTLFDAVRAAAAVGLAGLGIMDVAPETLRRMTVDNPAALFKVSPDAAAEAAA